LTAAFGETEKLRWPAAGEARHVCDFWQLGSQARDDNASF
jgi:hypothetical protein